MFKEKLNITEQIHSEVKQRRSYLALPFVSGLQKVGFGAGFSFDAAVNALRLDPHVLYVEPD